MDIGNVRRKPKDYFKGYIKKDGEAVSHCYGNYMGYCDFDTERYFDVRQMDNYPITDLELDSKAPYCLQSDARHRIDL